MNKNVVLSGIRWTLITSIVRRIITLTLFFFIAEWLTKEDLGVFREYSIIIALFGVISFLSLDYHYIIEQNRSKSSLVAMWQISFIITVLGIIILSLFSCLIGAIYKSAMLGNFFAFTSIFLGVEVFRRTVRSMATKQFQFKQMALAETYNVVFYSIVSIAVLYFYRSIWVFLIVFYLGNVLELIYLWICNKTEISGILKRIFRKGRLRILALTLKANRSFLTQATLVSAINQVSSNAPILLLGLMIKPELIGLYYFSSQVIGIPVGMFSSAVNQVFFPVFAGKKDGDIGNMAARYVRIIGNLGLPTLLIFSYIMTFVVSWLFHGKWDDAIPLIMPLFILFGASLYCTPLGGIPFVKRKPRWELYWNIAGLTIKTCAMFIGLQISFVMAIWYYAIASAISNIAFYFMSMVLVQQKISVTLKNVITSLIPTLILSLVIVVIINIQAWLTISIALASYCLLLLIINATNKGLLLSDIRILTDITKE